MRGQAAWIASGQDFEVKMDPRAAARCAHNTEWLTKADDRSGFDTIFDIGEMRVAGEDALPMINQDRIAKAWAALGFADRTGRG